MNLTTTFNKGSEAESHEGPLPTQSKSSPPDPDSPGTRARHNSVSELVEQFEGIARIEASDGEGSSSASNYSLDCTNLILNLKPSPTLDYSSDEASELSFSSDILNDRKLPPQSTTTKPSTAIPINMNMNMNMNGKPPTMSLRSLPSSPSASVGSLSSAGFGNYISSTEVSPVASQEVSPVPWEHENKNENGNANANGNENENGKIRNENEAVMMDVNSAIAANLTQQQQQPEYKINLPQATIEAPAIPAPVSVSAPQQQQQQQQQYDSALYTTTEQTKTQPQPQPQPQLQPQPQQSWVKYFNDDNYPYYLNSVTGESSWDPPVEYSDADNFGDESKFSPIATPTTTPTPTPTPTTTNLTPTPIHTHTHTNLNQTNLSSQTPLHIVSSRCTLPGIKLLLSNGASPNALDSNEQTPLHTLASNPKSSHPPSLIVSCGEPSLAEPSRA